MLREPMERVAEMGRMICEAPRPVPSNQIPALQPRLVVEPRMRLGRTLIWVLRWTLGWNYSAGDWKGSYAGCLLGLLNLY